jgi:hypothetical protein
VVTNPASGPKGIYVVDDGDVNFSKALASNLVDGALVRVGWDKIETSDNVFNFTTLCNKITTAHSVGKKVSLVNYANVPAWLVNTLPSDQTWTSPLFGLQPLPWNATALSQMRDFANAEAAFVCGGYPLKSHPAILQVDAPILGMQSIRNAPTGYNINTLTTAVLDSVSVWIEAFGGEKSHNFYVGLFPLGSSTTDAVTIRDSILKTFTSFNFFQETWTGAGPSGNLATPLAPNVTTRTFNVMLQACGYWSDTSKIKCTFATNDNIKLAYDNIAADFQTKYLEIYPADILYTSYQSDLTYIHDLIWK